MNDAELLAHGARRVVARPEDVPLMQPCRVSLRDSEAGEVSILLHFPHHVVPTSPYRAGGPIFVREGVSEMASFINHVPEQQRIRLLSVRGVRCGRHHGRCRCAGRQRVGNGDRADVPPRRRRVPARAQCAARMLFVPD
jgi:hypothetical protein